MLQLVVAIYRMLQKIASRKTAKWTVRGDKSAVMIPKARNERVFVWGLGFRV